MINNRFLFIVSVLLLIAGLGYVFERVFFLQKAFRTRGSVTNISATNGRCGGGRRSRSYDCTKFSANILFYTENAQRQSFSVSSGSARGHNQSISRSRLPINSAVSVVYDPENPAEAYEDTIWGVWATPIMLLLGHLGSLFSSFMRPRARSGF